MTIERINNPMIGDMGTQCVEILRSSHQSELPLYEIVEARGEGEQLWDLSGTTGFGQLLSPINQGMGPMP